MVMISNTDVLTARFSLTLNQCNGLPLSNTTLEVVPASSIEASIELKQSYFHNFTIISQSESNETQNCTVELFDAAGDFLDEKSFMFVSAQ